MKEKIKTIEELQQIIADLKSKGKRSFTAMGYLT
jgi:hypothetical protein